MNILGEGEARGGVSILHALGTGKGCSVGVNLLTKVKLVDKKSENLQDKHKLLDSVIKCWKAEGFPLPKEYGWDISSEVPIGQGLKSSSALACAAIKSLDSASWMNLNNFEIIDLAVKAQKGAGCTITGSIDDAWCALRPPSKRNRDTHPNLSSSLDDVTMSAISGSCDRGHPGGS